MSAELLHDEAGEKPRLTARLVDPPWRMPLSIFVAGMFLAVGLIAPQLPNLFPHVRLGWALACFLLAISGMGMVSSDMTVRLIGATVGTGVTLALFQYLIDYDLIADAMVYRTERGDFVWQETLVGMLVFAPLLVLHVARIESYLETVPMGRHTWEGARMGLMQSGWLALVVVVLLFAGPIIGPLKSPDIPSSLSTPWENPWFVVSVGGSLLLAGIVSGAIAALLGCTVPVGQPASVADSTDRD